MDTTSAMVFCNVLHQLLLHRVASHNTVAGVLFTTVFVIAIPLKQMMLQVNRSDGDTSGHNSCDGLRAKCITPKPILLASVVLHNTSLSFLY